LKESWNFNFSNDQSIENCLLYASFAYVQICQTCSTFLLKFKESEEIFNGANVQGLSQSQSIIVLKADTLLASAKYILI
jgi:hypothetical protein